MSRIWHVMRREYLENVRTKAFLIGLVLTPIWMGLIFVIPAMVRSSGPEKRDLVVVDQTGRFARQGEAATPEGPLVEALASTKQFEIRVEDAAEVFQVQSDGSTRLEALKQEAGRGELIGIVLTNPILEKRPPGEGELASEIFGPQSLAAAGRLGHLLTGIVNEVVTNDIVERRQIDPADAAIIQKRAIASYTALDEKGERGSIAGQIAPFVFMMMLFMGIVGISQMLISSTLEEKSNRVFEVLLSSLSSYELMVGKILGICGVGFTLLTLWSGGGLAALLIQDYGDIVSAADVGYFLGYYLLGFLLIASLMVAVGSACNTLKEAQNLMAPISLLLALPILLAMVVMENPNGELATIGSFIPPFTPFLMMVRIASVPAPPTWQIVLSIVLLVVSVLIAFRLAARVFRVGILMHGQPPRLKDILRWMFKPGS